MISSELFHLSVIFGDFFFENRGKLGKFLKQIWILFQKIWKFENKSKSFWRSRRVPEKTEKYQKNPSENLHQNKYFCFRKKCKMFRKLCHNVKLMQNRRTFSPFTHYQSICHPNLVNSSLPKMQCLFYVTTKDTQLHVDNKTTKISDTNQSIFKLEKILRCNRHETTKLYEYLSSNSERVDIDAINKTVKWLRRIGATSPVVLKNCHILLLPLGRYAFDIFQCFFHNFKNIFGFF